MRQIFDITRLWSGNDHNSSTYEKIPNRKKDSPDSYYIFFIGTSGVRGTIKKKDI